jgi:undecaprenyl pyrophosphate synthase
MRAGIRAAFDAFDVLDRKRLAAKSACRPRRRHLCSTLAGNRRGAKKPGYEDPREGGKAPGAKVVEFLQRCDCAQRLEKPETDLIIRASGQQRLSGFPSRRSADAEVYFCARHWPDFRESSFPQALRSSSVQDRRYGR